LAARRYVIDLGDFLRGLETEVDFDDLERFHREWPESTEDIGIVGIFVGKDGSLRCFHLNGEKLDSPLAEEVYAAGSGGTALKKLLMDFIPQTMHYDATLSNSKQRALAAVLPFISAFQANEIASPSLDGFGGGYEIAYTQWPEGEEPRIVLASSITYFNWMAALNGSIITTTRLLPGIITQNYQQNRLIIGRIMFPALVADLFPDGAIPEVFKENTVSVVEGFFDHSNEVASDEMLIPPMSIDINIHHIWVSDGNSLSRASISRFDCHDLNISHYDGGFSFSFKEEFRVFFQEFIQQRPDISRLLVDGQ
jgi:hypothetical protein